jgi:recombination protein RecT
MSVADIMEIYHEVVKKNKGAAEGPWETHFDEMAKKTVVRRLCKYLASSSERSDLQRAIVLDERADAGLPQDLSMLIDPSEKPSDDPQAMQLPQRAATAEKPAPQPATKKQEDIPFGE